MVLALVPMADRDQVFKITSIFAMLVLGIIFALLPRKIQGNPRLLSILNMLTGGIFLGIAFCHMLAESHEDLEHKFDHFPMAFFLAGAGFIVTLIMEQIAHTLTGKKKKPSADSDNADLKSAMLTTGSSSSDNLANINAAVIPHAHEHDHAHGHDDEDGHGHSHLPADMNGSNIITVIAVWIALCFHSIMEGLALGASEDDAALFAAIVGHKGMDAFALGASMVRNNTPMKRHVIFSVIFSIMSPLGVLLGMLLSHYSEGAVAPAIVSCLAAGTFLYVAILEIVANELANKKDAVLKLLMLLVGYGLACVLAIWA